MFNIEKFMQSEEKEIYRVTKKKWPIPAMIIFCPLWIAFSLMVLIPCFKNLFLGAISFDSYGMYLVSIFSLVFFVSFSIFLPISYILNQLIISDKRVFIRKGLCGKLIIINTHDIVAFQNMHISTRGGDIEKICFYLSCGKRIRTGDLYIKKESLTSLLEILNKKICMKVDTRKQIRELKKDRVSLCEMITVRNLIFPTVSIIPFLIALLMFSLYISGFNEKGTQQNLYILGTVKEKYIDYDNKNNEITGYNITVKANTSNERYKIPIEEQQYKAFEESDKIFIKAQKGSLGLVYNENIYIIADTDEELAAKNNWSGTWEMIVTLDDGTKDYSKFTFDLEAATVTWDTEPNDEPYVYPLKIVNQNTVEFYQPDSIDATDRCVYNSDGTITRTFLDTGQTYLLTKNSKVYTISISSTSPVIKVGESVVLTINHNCPEARVFLKQEDYDFINGTYSQSYIWEDTYSAFTLTGLTSGTSTMSFYYQAPDGKIITSEIIPITIYD